MTQQQAPAHDLFSPSKMATIRACPGYLNHNKDRPEEPSGPAAIDGTHTHTLGDACLSSNTWDAYDFLGASMMDHEGTFVVDVERADRVNVYLNYIGGRIEVANLKGASTTSSEHPVHPGKLIGRNDWRGTADCVIKGLNFAEVIDYKDGRHPVNPDCDQLYSYGLGILADFNKEDLPETIRLTIVQPKISPTPTWVEMSTQTLLEKLPEFRQVISDALEPNAPRIPGDHCTWCPGKAQCPEYTHNQQQALETAFSGIDLPKAQAPVLKDVSGTISNEELAKVLDAEPLVTVWFKEMREEALRRFQGGDRVPGQKVVRADTKRAWIKDTELIIKKLKSKRLAKADIFENKLRALTKVLGNSKLNDKQRKDIEKTCINKPEGALIVVPETDKRKEVLFDARALFDKAPEAKELTGSDTFTLEANNPNPPPGITPPAGAIQWEKGERPSTEEKPKEPPLSFI